MLHKEIKALSQNCWQNLESSEVNKITNRIENKKQINGICDDSFTDTIQAIFQGRFSSRRKQQRHSRRCCSSHRTAVPTEFPHR